MMGRKALDAAQWLMDELGLEPSQITAQQFLTEREEVRGGSRSERQVR